MSAGPPSDLETMFSRLLPPDEDDGQDAVRPRAYEPPAAVAEPVERPFVPADCSLSTRRQVGVELIREHKTGVSEGLRNALSDPARTPSTA